ncbi:hypothetical protein GCM10009724_20510 [Microbacterium lacticum]|nr:hypothetical protein GCM10009724_20510 [Microbacterium lacticum]
MTAPKTIEAIDSAIRTQAGMRSSRRTSASFPQIPVRAIPPGYGRARRGPFTAAGRRASATAGVGGQP